MFAPLKTLVALTLLATAATAHAMPDFSVGGYRGPVTIEWDNWESFTDNGSGMLLPGDLNYGLGKVTRVLASDGSGQVLWSDGGNGQEMWGVFRDITVSALTPDASGVYLDAVGGELALYLNPYGTAAAAGGAAQGTAGYANAGCAINTLCYSGITDSAAGWLALSLRWVVGIAPDVAVRGLFTSFTPPVGTAGGYLEVTGGRYASMFDDSHLLAGDADMLFDNNIIANGLDGNPEGNWQLLSKGKLLANVVPEPASAALGLLALGALAATRRRKA